jgi:hypothetical protein
MFRKKVDDTPSVYMEEELRNEVTLQEGDIVISSKAGFDDILEKFSEHSEKFMGDYMTPEEILEEMQGYV